jgi:hypothetical protein
LYFRALKLKTIMKISSLFTFLLFSFLTNFSFSQSATIRGFLYEQSNGEPMPFQKVKIISSLNTIYGSVTDVNGFFSIPKLAIGTYTIKIEADLFELIEEKISITKANQILDVKYNLKKGENIKEIDEVNVTAEGKRKKTEVSMSVIKLDKKGLERIPSVGAENDVVGAFSVTPGVVTTGDQGGQLYVRGGTPIQNKILLDGMTIYTPFHSIGFFSIFETELVKNVDIYTGGFDSKIRW